VIISDGDPAAPSVNLLNALKDAQISVSTVCIAPHSPNDQGMLQWIAQATGGNYYFVTNPNSLPQIFSKEAAIVKRGLLIEEPFVPQVFHDSELLQGIEKTGIPQLGGYVVTTQKETATVPLVSKEKDPVLAHWRYGLGKSVAFTSDVTSRWAADWIKWPGFNPFWAQTVRWAMREISPTNFRVETRAREGFGYVRIDAIDDKGKFVNFLRPKGAVTGPGPDFTRQELALSQTEPGVYEGRFPLGNRGLYMINMTYERGDGSQGMMPTGLALGYSREYEYTTTNIGLLENLAATGGGLVRAPYDNPFAHDLKVSATITPMWPYLVATAVSIFPLEIFIRRVVIDFQAVWVALLSLLRKLPGIKRWIKLPIRRKALTTGAYAGAQAKPLAFEQEAAPSETDFDTGTTTKPAPTTEPEPEPKKEKSEYMKQLLEAKQRAAQKYDGKK
jgi:hypothetical protein